MQHTHDTEKKICKLIKNHVCTESSTKTIFNRRKAFTLIELLVVIAIIGLLSTIVLSSLSSAREKARDAKKGVIVKQWITALALNYDTTDEYPTDGTLASFVYACLGEGYPTLANGQGYECVVFGDESVTVNTALSEEYPALPITEEKITAGDYDYRGIGYGRCDRLNCEGISGSDKFEILWYLETDTDSDVGNCPIGSWYDSDSPIPDFCRYQNID
jgi:prepilin-type N-terminal cleavage/methylation domain-containing protein